MWTWVGGMGVGEGEKIDMWGVIRQPRVYNQCS